MIRFLIVINHGYKINDSEFQREFEDCDVLVVRETDQFMRVVCEHNPHVIVSLGPIGQLSFLWSMPLWRRSRWLNLPDTKVSASSVRMSALSLIAATSTGDLFRDEPIVSCVTMDDDPRDVAQTIIQVSEAIEYDNIEFLVSSRLFFEVLELLGVHKSVAAICRFSEVAEDAPLNLLRSALAKTRALYLWPVSFGAVVHDPCFLHNVVDVLGKQSGSAVIIGKNPSRDLIVKCLDGSVDIPISQMIFRPEHLLSVFQFENDFPLDSLSGLLLVLLNNSATCYVRQEEVIGLTPQKWWLETDQNQQIVKQASIRHTQQRQVT
jgi:hypothetical protein